MTLEPSSGHRDPENWAVTVEEMPCAGWVGLPVILPGFRDFQREWVFKFRAKAQMKGRKEEELV